MSLSVRERRQAADGAGHLRRLVPRFRTRKPIDSNERVAAQIRGLDRVEVNDVNGQAEQAERLAGVRAERAAAHDKNGSIVQNRGIIAGERLAAPELVIVTLGCKLHKIGSLSTGVVRTSIRAPPSIESGAGRRRGSGGPSAS